MRDSLSSNWVSTQSQTIQLRERILENVDQQQTQNINQAMEQLADSAQQSFQMLADRTVRVQERNLMLTQTFFQNWIEQVHNQAQATRGATQDLQEQGQRQRDAFETLSEEASNV